MNKILFSFILSILINPVGSYAENALTKFSELSNVGLLVLDDHGQPVFSDHAQQAFIPASTTKIVTAWLALNNWGEEHRFHTDFYLDTATQILWVKGRGDPFLVSEELQLIAHNLKQRGLQQINAIALDTSYFQPNLLLPGTGRSNNPYDAVPAAIAANFNTVNIKKLNGRVVSAESQTPLTAYAKSLSKQIKKGTLRVNTGRNPRHAERYFAELLAVFLRQQGVKVGQRIVRGQVPVATVFYQHFNSKTLAEMIRPMLKYSTNFLANQLVLKLSVETYQRSANASDVQHYLEQTLLAYFHWQNFTVQEGAGLSRANRLSPTQLVDVLRAFTPWKHLLPEIEPGVYAKSGTLNGVSTLAGYLVVDNVWEPFALMMNQAVPYRYRNRIARELVERSRQRVRSD